jgi:hypothetical protein
MASTNKPSRAPEGQTRTVFIRRLERLMRLRRDYLDDLNPLGLRLLDRALYATYRDCLDYGATQEANEIMAKHPIPGWDEDVRKAS